MGKGKQMVRKDKGAAQPHRPKQRKPHLARKTVGVVLATLLLVVAGVLNVALADPSLGGLVTRIMGNTEGVTQEAKDDVNQRARAAADEVESEGVVLAQNDGTLPLDSSVTKVNVFGWASTAWLGGGSGSGGVSSVEVDLIDALNAKGIETNTELTQMYTDFADAEKDENVRPKTLQSKPEESSVLFEPSIDDKDYYSDQLLADAKDFSDTAIVVIGRWAGESNDSPLAQYKVTTKGGEVQVDDSRTSLDLSCEEEALLAYVGQNYDNVIVVVNAANAMTLGAVETTPGVDACLLAGYTGQYSAEVLPDVLWGQTNPSGRTADTWAYAFDSAPSYANASEHVGAYEGADGLYPMDGETTNGNFKEKELYDQVSYVDYSEGIYVGYRWYETADAEGYWAGQSNDHGQGYDAVVQYPFGYGLSYTNFDWEVVDAPESGSALGDQNSMTVRVTNTGKVAGKDVVELYFSAPYTQGGIEKSVVELGDFAKTKLLEPGESQDLTLTVSARDMASYDCYDKNDNGFAGYELDPGMYELTLRHDAHSVDDAAGATVDLTLDQNEQFPTDEATGAEVSNKFTGADAIDGVSLDGLDDGQNVQYLSRADFEGTWPDVASSRAIPDDVRERNLYTEEDAQADDASRTASAPTMGQAGDLRIEEDGVIIDLGRQLGANYDDPQWDALLDQVSQDEMEFLVTHAYSGTAPVASVGHDSDTKEADGPSQIGGFIPVNAGTGFPCAVVMAQTWNPELANQMGLLVGVQASQRGYSGWYGPAVNIHRSPFDGRNYEYYSEDPLLSGVMCGNVVAGAKDAGVYCYVKHFICNDGEAYVYRDAVSNWMSEQTLREIYLEPFRMLVEDYDGTALMTSYNRMGATWAGGNKALLNGVLRGEWGFKGAVVTDFADHPVFMNGDQEVRAGGDLWMNMMGGEFMESGSDSAAFQQDLRAATKHVLYSYLEARVANEKYVAASGNDWAARPASSTLVSPVPGIVTGVTVAAVGLEALAIWRLVVGIKLKRQLKRAAAGDKGSEAPKAA